MSFLSFERLFYPLFLNSLAKLRKELIENSLDRGSVLPCIRDVEFKNFCLMKLNGFPTAYVSPLKFEFKRF